MKKSQVLAALALAFALGVVAPVVSTTNTVSAFTVADNNAKPKVKGSATAAEVNTAVAAVKANATYINMMNLKEQVEKANSTTDKEYVDITTGMYNNIQKFTVTVDTDPAVAKVFTDLDKSYANDEINFSEKLSSAIAEAKKVEYYNVLAPIFAAATPDADGAYDNAAYRTALLNFNAYFAGDFTSTNKPLEVHDDTTVTGATAITLTTVENTFKALTNNANLFGGMKNLCNAVETASTANEKYNKGVTALMNALEANGVLNKDGQLELAEIKNKKYLAIRDLTSLANDTYINKYTAWTVDVEAALKNAAKPLNIDCEANYNTIIALATAYRSAEGIESQTIEQVAQTLVGYKAPAAQNTLTEGPVTVTGAFPADLKLSVVKSDKKVAAFGDAKYGMWDINLVDAKNNKVTYNGSVMVTIEVPEGIDAAKSSVYFVTDEGKVEKLAARVENGKMVFTTSHFSLYAIVEDNGKNFGINAPDTGIIMNTEAGATTTVAMVAGVATALTAAGAGVVAYRNARRSTRK